MASGSQPLAFAELAFGGLLLTSAITGESISELLTNGLTPAGKERLHAKGQSESETGSGEGSPKVSASSQGLAEEGAEGTGGRPGTAAVPPSVAGKRAKVAPSSSKRLEELRHGLMQALKFKEKVGKEYSEGRISKRAGEQKFNQAFPWYAIWAKELKELLR